FVFDLSSDNNFGKYHNLDFKDNDYSNSPGPVKENIESDDSELSLDQNLEGNNHSDHLGPVGENVELNDNYHNDPTISPVTGRDFNLRKRERIDYNVGSTRKRPKHKH
ncbi:5392_t:CDS:2, partial [Entrophospora sp. SA101]